MVDENTVKTDTQKVSYKDTLNLPQTTFPIRSNPTVDDPLLLDRWATEDLYKKTFVKNEGNKKFILHDGPPYANASIHLGTAYNKILKDIFTKSHRMAGFHTPVTPGWDCHGLPIELKVSKEFPGLDPIALKKKCRESATYWIDVQRKEFKQLGVFMDWDNPYLTMSPDYEAETVKAFGLFVERGFIARKNKTVSWCYSCQTVLASAEIEYHERKDPSIYVLFPVEITTAKKAFPTVSEPVSLLIWTTTPWTLPLNKMVILKPEASYDVLDINGTFVVVGTQLANKVCAKLEVAKKVVATCKAEALVGGNAHHPFIEGQLSPLLSDHFVSLDEGTAFVHGAPGCGQEDYEVGVRNGIEIFSPITPDGKYAKGIKPVELEGQDVDKAHGWVIKTLQENGNLLFKESIKHSYPHCWRCRNGLIFRATKQWFCDLSHNNLRDTALANIEKMAFSPERTRARLKASVGGRLEWCLSRQRVWGTPIVAALCNDCDTEFVDYTMIENVAKVIATEGIEFWDRVDLASVLPQGTCCRNCKSTNFRKETDILDVWFDSGVSHFAVLKKNPALAYPADLYSEGSDQHRGWFQSSLLTSAALEGTIFSKTIATHGYTVDDKGRKMSKSLGNVVVPQEIITKLGTDGLRLWVTSNDLESDVVVSESLMENVKEVLRKIRNTSRFLVSNLYDFDYETDAVPVEKMCAIDQYALQQLAHFNTRIRKAYTSYDVTALYHEFADYCASDLSAFYLDIIKDRLYTDAASGHERRSAQTACWQILDTMTKLMAPVLSFTAEQLSDCYQKNKKESIHLQDFPEPSFVWVPTTQKETVKNNAGAKECVLVSAEKREQQWQALRNLRSSVLKTIEQLRQKGIVKHSLEAKVILSMKTTHAEAQPLRELLSSIEAAGQKKEQFLKEFFIISACQLDEVDEYEEDEEIEVDEEGNEVFEFATHDTTLVIKTGHAEGIKCPRCWQWEVTDHEHGLCHRCQSVVSKK